EASAADAGPGDDEDVLEDRHAEDPPEPDAGHPVVAAEVPGRLREVLVPIAAAALQYRHAIALLGEAEGGHRPAEAGPHHEPVVVVISRQLRHRRETSRRR